jgi:glyoxylase-like metal-dependent hydrolase (beta-lactamase superfamily II)
MPRMARTTTEVADGIHVLNYRYLNQNIGVIVGRDEIAVIDTRSSGAQAREILDDVRRLTRLPVTVVIDTHGHSDHAFGNVAFRGAAIWGHRGCPPFLARTGAQQKRDTAKELPDEAEDILGLELVPPDRLVDEREGLTSIEVGGRAVELAHLGRGHTDHDLLIRVPEPGALFAGDLVVKSDFPFFGDSFPLDFPATLDAIGGLAWETLITGHGGLADRTYLAMHRERVASLADVARRAHAAGAPWKSAVGEVPLPKSSASDGLRRAYAQLNGEL